MAFKILYGGRARPGFPVSSTYSASTEWEAGDILTIDATAGTLKKADSTTKGLVGLALEYRREVTGTDYSVDQTYASGKGSMVVDPAVIETDRVESGVTFTPMQRLYISTNGKLTNVAGDMVVGVCISGLDSENKITALWNPEYVT